ncbi:hypothetical protein BC936DRAFT_145473, partial [Jimgerdemannia flammicorona]
VRKRIRQLKDFITVTPDWINYALIDDITDSFAPLIQQIELEVDSIDDLVLLLRESEQSDMLRRIGHCRKKVMQLLRLLSTKADVVKGLMKRFEVANEMGLEAGAGVGGSSAPINAHKRAMHHNVALYLGDIQGAFGHLFDPLKYKYTGTRTRPHRHDGSKPQPLRDDPGAFALQLPGTDLDRANADLERHQRRRRAPYCLRHRHRAHEPCYRSVWHER